MKLSLNRHPGKSKKLRKHRPLKFECKPTLRIWINFKLISLVKFTDRECQTETHLFKIPILICTAISLRRF